MCSGHARRGACRPGERMVSRPSVDRGAPETAPYSDAIWAGDLLFLAGRVGLGQDGALVPGVGSQTAQAISNASKILAAAGLSLEDVVKCSVFLVTMADLESMNAAYTAAFAAPRPARTTVAVAALPLGALVEIDMIARRSGGSRPD